MGFALEPGPAAVADDQVLEPVVPEGAQAGTVAFLVLHLIEGLGDRGRGRHGGGLVPDPSVMLAPLAPGTVLCLMSPCTSPGLPLVP